MRKWLAGLLGLSLLMVTAAEGADVTELVKKLKSSDNDARRTAAKELGELGGEAKAAVPALTKALADKDLFVRRFAAEALGAIGPEAKSAISSLSKALNDSRKEVQLAAADALGKMGPSSVTALTNAVKDPAKDPAVRRKAAQSLATLGQEARGSVKVLASVLKGKMKKAPKGKTNDDDIRIDIATTLGAVATAEDTVAIEALKAVSEGKQKNKALKKAASDALRSITGEAPKKKKKDK